MESSVNNPSGVSGRIRLDLNDTTIWNKLEFLQFLVDNQTKVIDIEVPEGVCLRSLGVFELLDLFKFQSVNIRTFNLVQEKYPPYKMESHVLAFRYFDVPASVDYSQYHSWNGNYVFGAIYNRPTWERNGLTGHLASKYLDKTLLNFRFDPHDADQRTFFELDRLFQMHPESLKNFMSVQDLLPRRIEDTDGYLAGQTAKTHTDQLASFYPNFLIDIVAETFLQGRSFYPTEKTTRPILMKKPFILMGSKCFLIHLRQMGFRTFHDFWDEEYDGHYPRERYARILKLIDDLSKKSPEELQEMYSKMQPILDHNYNLLVTRAYNKRINYTE